MPDCGDNGCRYAKKKIGVRTNGGCTCDRCVVCGKSIWPNVPYAKHRDWCTTPDWVPEHLKTSQDK